MGVLSGVIILQEKNTMKKRIIFFAAWFVLFSFSSVQAQTSSVSPSTTRVPRGMQSTRSITWTLEIIGDPTPRTSSQGTFYTDSSLTNAIGTVNKSLTVTLELVPNTQLLRGSAGEVFSIPLSVIKKAEQAGFNMVYYSRNFFGSLDNQVAKVFIAITSAGRGNLSISRMRLYFENQKGEISVKRNEQRLKAFADIFYTGSGLLKGYWQIDGRIISHVNKHLVSGAGRGAETLYVPALPTFIDGTHDVKFIITSPQQGLALPKALYYVRPYEAERLIAISQTGPFNGAPVEYTAVAFHWVPDKTLATYLVEFQGEHDKKPIFSAYTRKAGYTLPPMAVKYYFKAGLRYLWKVKGFDGADNLAGESDVRAFRFNPE